MSRTNVAAEVSARTAGFMTKHPRLVATMVLLLVLIAVQGGVAAEAGELGDFATTSGSGSVDDGP